MSRENAPLDDWNGRSSGQGSTGAPGSGQQAYHLKDVTKHWAGEHGFVLSIPELTISRGEKVALVGFSGCGKSTLLDLLAMILRPDTAGEFAFINERGEPLDVNAAWKRKDLDLLASRRMTHLGYVLQTGGLLPFISVRDNIGLSREGLGLPVRDAVEKIAERLGIGRHLEKFPAQLSVGERQRVAIARAMVHEPSVVLADEPTASLDPINAEEIMSLFAGLAEDKGVTLILGTHDWGGVVKRGFRRIEFDIQQDKDRGTVLARVLA